MNVILRTRSVGVVLFVVLAGAGAVRAQPLGEPDRGAPGDAMIQKYLASQTLKLQASFADDLKSLADWQRNRPRYHEEFMYMLGLSPLPERTPLHATVTGTLEGDGFTIEMLHYQSRPRLYVTANLFRPKTIPAGRRLPAVLYVCGHSGRGRDGNKTAFQSHGIWFARHGYVCLIVDTLQLGEIAATHHGTYNQQRWWWHSRGYTSAGVECWNGVRGIDYLISRPDVDPERIGVTGISGGGAATFWVAAADDRVKVAVPVSGMADLESYVPNRVINGHCDCMFMYNTFQWPWTRIAGLIAPRPLLFVNSDQDAIFPMDANERVIGQLRRLYKLHDAADRVDALVSIGGHDYRQDIREGVYRFLNKHLKGDDRPIDDSEVDLVAGPNNAPTHPIAPNKLRVFHTDADLPADQLNTTIDQHFVPLVKVPLPNHGAFEQWKKPLLAELKRVSFGYFPKSVPAAKQVDGVTNMKAKRVQTESGIELELWVGEQPDLQGKSILIVVLNEDETGPRPNWIKDIAGSKQHVVYLAPRGVGDTRWTRKNPPNYVERSHVLLGRTVDTGRVWDVIAAGKHFSTSDRAFKVNVAGKGTAGLIAAYAATLDDSIAGVTLVDPPLTHMDSGAPQFLNILRVCDVPEMLGLLAPRPLTIVAKPDPRIERVGEIYHRAGVADHFEFKSSKP